MLVRNAGGSDRDLRLAAGIALLLALFVSDGAKSDVIAYVVGPLGIIWLVCGLTGSCLLYVPFHVSTARPSRWIVTAHVDGSGGIRAELRQGDATRRRSGRWRVGPSGRRKR